MAVDPNVYALSIQMQLDSGDAMDTLDQFSTGVSDVEKQVSDAAQSAMTSISDVASTVNNALTDSLKTTQAFSTASLDVEKAFQEIASQLDDMGDLSPEELDTWLEILDVFDDVIKTIDKKNLLHDEELKKIQQEKEAADELSEMFKEVTKGIRESVAAVTAITKAFAALMETIAKASDIQEKFVENNYRMYGSMDGIAVQVRDIGREYGVLEGEAIEAYKALADVRTPRDEIGRMTSNLVQMNRVTGVGMTTLAEYTKQLRGVGATAASTELHLNRMQDMMRKAGLSAEQMNGILGDTEVSMQTLTAMFGSREGAEYFKETQVAAAGMAQALGFSAEAVSTQLNKMATDIDTIALMAGRAGMAIPKTAEETEQVFMKVSELAAKEMQAIQDSNASLAEKNARMEALRESYGFHNQAALEASAAIGKEIERRRAAGEAIGDMNDLYESVTKSMEENYNATQRFARSWEDLKEATNGIFKEFWNLIGLVLTPMIKWLTRLANAVAWVVSWFTWLYDVARKLPVLGWIIQWGEELVGLIFAIVFVFVLLAAATGGLTTAFSGLAAAFSSGGGIISRVGTAIQNTARIMGNVVVEIFRAIGRGLQALGRAVQPVMLPLLALGAALMMAGLGAYFFASGVMMMASLPIGEMAARLFILVAAMITMIVAIAIVASVASPAVPVMYALGGALALIGLAALMMGAGLYLAAAAFQMIVDAIGPQSPPLWVKLPLVALGIMMVAAAAWFGVVPLMILAAAFLIAAVGAWVLAHAFVVIAGVIDQISSDKLIDIGYGVMIGGALFMAGAAMLLVGAGLLIAAAVLTAIAMAYLAPAAALMIPVGMQLLIGGALLFVASIQMLSAALMMFPASVMLFLSGMFILLGAVMMLTGAALLIPAAALLSAAGIALFAASIMFWFGVGAIFSAAASLMAVGIMVLIGGVGMYVGASMLYASTGILKAAASALKEAFAVLNEAIETMDFEGIARLHYASLLLAMAGIWLYIGGHGLLIGAVLLVWASVVLLLGAEYVSQAAQLMTPASEQFVQVGINFLIAGITMLIGASYILAATGILFASVYAMFFLAPMLTWAGYAMLVGAVLLYVVGLLLSWAGNLMVYASYTMMYAADIMMMAAEYLWWSGLALSLSGPMLAYGSMEVIWATHLLITAAFMLILAGRWLVPAAFAIWTGMWWLDAALSRFKNTIPVIEKVAAAVALLADSLQIMKDAPFYSLQNTARDGLAAIPMLNKFANQLPSVAERMASATEKFKKPASELAQVLNTLGDAILKFDGVGQGLAAEMESVSNTLDEYSFRLEAASQRIQTAVDQKAVPAMTAADNAGIDQAIRSEAITQVQVTTDTEGAEKATDEAAEASLSQLQVLNALNEKLGLMVGEGRANSIEEILSLLTAYLPEMANRRGGLSSEMNSWNK